MVSVADKPLKFFAELKESFVSAVFVSSEFKEPVVIEISKVPPLPNSSSIAT